MVPGYESTFGLLERPFSLAPEPRCFFADGGHGRALDMVVAGLGRREPFVLITGDLGVGKTLLGRTVASLMGAQGRVSFVRNPLMTPAGFLHLLGEDLRGPAARASVATSDPFQRVAETVRTATAEGLPAVVVIDDAHRLPHAMREVLLDLATPEPGRDRALQTLFLAQSPAHAPFTLGSAIDQRLRTRARLVPLNREECGAYVAHRLRLAGASATPVFSSRALDVLFGLSNGLPRLVNLLGERSLQEAAAGGQHTIEPGHIAAAAAALKLVHARPRRFRWFSRRVS